MWRKQVVNGATFYCIKKEQWSITFEHWNLQRGAGVFSLLSIPCREGQRAETGAGLMALALKLSSMSVTSPQGCWRTFAGQQSLCLPHSIACIGKHMPRIPSNRNRQLFHSPLPNTPAQIQSWSAWTRHVESCHVIREEARWGRVCVYSVCIMYRAQQSSCRVGCLCFTHCCRAVSTLNLPDMLFLWISG